MNTNTRTGLAIVLLAIYFQVENGNDVATPILVMRVAFLFFGIFLLVYGKGDEA